MISMMDSSNPPMDDDVSGPESLLDQCFVGIVRDLSTICFMNETTDLYELHPGLVLPRELCEKLIWFYCQNVGILDDKFVNIFHDTSVTSMKRVCLRNSSVSDKGLKVLLEHKLVELNLERCPNVTARSLNVLNKYGENLVCLAVGTDVKLLPNSLDSANTHPADGDHHLNKPVLNTPKLKRLTIQNFMFGQNENTYFDCLFQNLHNLTHLDLSGCLKIQYFSFLPSLKNLIFLVLHNVVQVQDGLPSICKMTNLR